MHLSAFFIFLISVTNEVRADFNDIVHASLLTLKHEKDSPTMHDFKFFAAKAGIMMNVIAVLISTAAKLCAARLLKVTSNAVPF